MIIEDDMKECPFCAELVRSKAIKCKHCSSDLADVKPVTGWWQDTYIFHWRNIGEGIGWLNAEHTPASAASLHFWNEFQNSVVSRVDKDQVDAGFEIVLPRDASCVTVQSIRNAEGQDKGLVVLGAVLTSGASLIGNTIGFYKWWPDSLTLRYRHHRKESSENGQETSNLWLFGGKFRRAEFGKDGVEYWWDRPSGWDADALNAADQWVKTPCNASKLMAKPQAVATPAQTDAQKSTQKGCLIVIAVVIALWCVLAVILPAFIALLGGGQ